MIYRKGVVKTVPEKIHVLPAHLASTVLFYTVADDNSLPYSSMAHATGRKGPRSLTKVDVEKVRSLRNLVYIPEGISDRSLVSEHPDAYNDVYELIRNFGKDIAIIGESRILGYVGQI